MFLYEFAEKTAQKPDTVATYVRRNKKIFKNHVERRQKQIWLDEKAVDILLKKYPSVYHVFGGGQDYFLQSSFFIANSSA